MGYEVFKHGESVRQVMAQPHPQCLIHLEWGASLENAYLHVFTKYEH